MFNGLGDILRYYLLYKVLFSDEWEDALTGLSRLTAMAETFVGDDDVPLMQKYQAAQRLTSSQQHDPNALS